jgi:hypothetical protein
MFGALIAAAMASSAYAEQKRGGIGPELLAIRQKWAQDELRRLDAERLARRNDWSSYLPWIVIALFGMK